MSKTLDLLVWGATGITGRRVCLQLAKKYSNSIRWGIAGRNQTKLTDIQKEIKSVDPKCKDIPIFLADLENKDSVCAMVRQARLVIACAGPFPLYSDLVVEACVQEETHCLDVTGEVLWSKSVIDRFHEEAQRKNVKIVNFCGFDSVPADIGSQYLVNYVRERYGRGVEKIVGTYTAKTSGRLAFSGGTFASFLNMLSLSKEEQNCLKDPYILNPADNKPKDNPSDQLGPRYDKDFGFWTAPFLMEPVNSRVVRRSSALSPQSYGKDFHYSECKKAKSFFNASFESFALGVFLVVCSIGILRKVFVALGFLPGPGKGPSISDEKKSSWKLTLHGLVEKEEGASSNASPIIVKATIGDHHGGYISTARMVVECAMCEILESSQLAEASLIPNGVLTPAAAFGEVLRKRLENISIKTKILN